MKNPFTDCCALKRKASTVQSLFCPSFLFYGKNLFGATKISNNKWSYFCTFVVLHILLKVSIFNVETFLQKSTKLCFAAVCKVRFTATQFDAFRSSSDLLERKKTRCRKRSWAHLAHSQTYPVCSLPVQFVSSSFLFDIKFIFFQLLLFCFGVSV